MIIRQEKPEDYLAVYQLVKEAFLTAEHSDGTEQDLVNRLRHSNNFVPELSLVAEENQQIIGYLLLTEIQIAEHTELALAPLAVKPDFQQKGIGKALILKAHEIAKSLGYHYIVVLGSNKYYSKFGYQPASQWDIHAPFDVPDELFMAIPLTTKYEIKGVVKYATEFGL